MRARYCQLCNRRLRKDYKHTLWCVPCLKLHTLGGYCHKCGAVHYEGVESGTVVEL